MRRRYKPEREILWLAVARGRVDNIEWLPLGTTVIDSCSCHLCPGSSLSLSALLGVHPPHLETRSLQITNMAPARPSA